jgi:hypothetical protein
MTFYIINDNSEKDKIDATSVRRNILDVYSQPTRYDTALVSFLSYCELERILNSKSKTLAVSYDNGILKSFASIEVEDYFVIVNLIGETKQYEMIKLLKYIETIYSTRTVKIYAFSDQLKCLYDNGYKFQTERYALFKILYPSLLNNRCLFSSNVVREGFSQDVWMSNDEIINKLKSIDNRHILLYIGHINDDKDTDLDFNQKQYRLWIYPMIKQTYTSNSNIN